MKIKRSTILELGQILKEDYDFELEFRDLEKLAYSLIGSYYLLAKADRREKFGNSSNRLLDSVDDWVEDKVNEN